MKKYAVLVTPEAERGILAAFRYIHEHSPLRAAQWLRALDAKLDTLEHYPKRCSLAREHKYFDAPLRQLVFRQHRIVFRVEVPSHVVRILYVVHGKQRTVGELDEGPD